MCVKKSWQENIFVPEIGICRTSSNFEYRLHYPSYYLQFFNYNDNEPVVGVPTALRISFLTVTEHSCLLASK
jgi:hypothetical protein